MLNIFKNLFKRTGQYERPLTDSEKLIIELVQKKHGKSKKDSMFFLEDGSVIYEAWGDEGNGPWVHLSNLASWYSSGDLSLEEIYESQI